MDIVALLNYLGITHDRALPFAILVAAMCWISFKFTSPIKKTVSAISRAMLEIQTVFKNNGNLTHHLTEGPGSPLSPTPFGKQLIVDSGLQDILDENKEFLKNELTKKLQKNYTEYDVQEKARELLVGLKDNALMNPVKKYAYEPGKDVDIILKTGGLWLRDDFLGQPRKTLPEKRDASPNEEV